MNSMNKVSLDRQGAAGTLLYSLQWENGSCQVPASFKLIFENNNGSPAYSEIGISS